MKRILVINFFPAFTPPSSGGELRYFHLYSRLSDFFDVTLLSPTYAHHQREVVTHSSTFREHRIPKAGFEETFYERIASEHLAEEFSALVCALASRRPNAFHEAYCELQANADLIIHEFPYMIEYDFLIGLDGKPRIYSSHNVESDLASQMWKGQSAAAYIALIEDLERRLVSQSDACFSVSTNESERFSRKFDTPLSKFHVIANGVMAEEFLSRPSEASSTPVALFFGSFHPPNIEAAQYIVEVLAPRFPQVLFLIAGSCYSESRSNLPPNVEALGKVSDEQRLALFSGAHIALNPMRSGAGTNLKSLEYLAAGLPLLTTPLGARGLDLNGHEHAILAEIDEFPAAFQELISNLSLRKHVAASGRQHVINRFTWDSIALRAKSAINAVLHGHTPSSRRHILLLNDFSVTNPMGGGEVRINRLYTALAQFYDITLVCLGGTDLFTRTEIAPGFVEIRVPKNDAHLQSQQSHNWHISAADIINYQQAPHNSLLVAIVKALTAHSDAIVLSHPYMVGLVDETVDIPIIYESHNVETELKRALLIGHPAYSEMTAAAAECEKRAIELSTALVSVSVADVPALLAIGGAVDKIDFVPNGVELPDVPIAWRSPGSLRNAIAGRPLLVFVGSAHPPNVDAAKYIVNELAPILDSFIFGIIGSVCDAIGGTGTQNVVFFGPLDALTKAVVLEAADIALNPMMTGSGSNLKLADYFAHSLPTVTTPFGARGYMISTGVEAIICPLEQFADELTTLMNSPMQRRRLGETAYAFAKANLAWHRQAEKYHSIIERYVFAEKRKRLLVVTHRFNNPPLGGAESHLIDLIKALAHRGDFLIDLIATDITTIENEFHFSCKYERDDNQTKLFGHPAVKVMRFPVDELEPTVRMENSAKLWAAWTEESIQSSIDHLDLLPDVILLGGWYHPEKDQDVVKIWSSARGMIKVRNVASIRLIGSSNHSTVLTLIGDGRVLSATLIAGSFDLKQVLNGVDVLELRVSVTCRSPMDPRALGLLVQEFHVENDVGEKTSLPLDIAYSDILKGVASRRYIKDLINTAEKRPDKLDTLFQDTRGPNSSAMEEWLRTNAGNYAVILGHSLPFKTAVMAADASRATGVPLVQLPSVHIDDRFYHWRSYFEALRTARLCITHPQSASELFFDPIGAPSRYFPPGLDSGSDVTSVGEAEFAALYQSTLPYVLVLGRKDRSKNYQTTISAIARLNSPDRRCNLVMIGRDEDGESLDPTNVMYLGACSKDLVQSALNRCLCLVTMSDSESFGMVILEAWNHGRPVIVSEFCIASTELVSDGDCGLVANSSTLTEKIRSLLDNPKWADEMGGRGHSLVQARFRWEVIGTELNNALLQLSGGHTAPGPGGIVDDPIPISGSQRNSESLDRPMKLAS